MWPYLETRLLQLSLMRSLERGLIQSDWHPIGRGSWMQRQTFTMGQCHRPGTRCHLPAKERHQGRCSIPAPWEPTQGHPDVTLHPPKLQDSAYCSFSHPD
jgi:hypothetical protein